MDRPLDWAFKIDSNTERPLIDRMRFSIGDLRGIDAEIVTSALTGLPSANLACENAPNLAEGNVTQWAELVLAAKAVVDAGDLNHEPIHALAWCLRVLGVDMTPVDHPKNTLCHWSTGIEGVCGGPICIEHGPSAVCETPEIPKGVQNG